jgi:hypothetical protein
MGDAGRRVTRRGFLGALALALAGVGYVFALTRFLPASPKRPPHDQPLPGAGSIFQPRRDARLEEWERQHQKPDL